MPLIPFEVQAVINVQEGDDDFELFDFSTVKAGLDGDGDHGLIFESLDRLRYDDPLGWDPDSWVVAGWLQPAFGSSDNERHVLWTAYANPNNYIEISKEADNAFRARVRYSGYNHDAELIPDWNSGDTIFVAAMLPQLGEPLNVYLSNNGTLDSASSPRVGVAYPTLDVSGRFYPNSEDTGVRWVSDGSGRVHLEDNNPANGMIYLLNRVGRFVLIDE